MKMKNCMVLLMCLYILNLSGQKIVSKFAITEAIYNKENKTALFVGENACTVFYIAPDGEMCMANMWLNKQTQSYGHMRLVDRITHKKRAKKEKVDYNFRWYYQNSYDDKKGVALVKLTEFREEGNMFYTMKMILENKDVITFKGVGVSP